MMLGPAGIVVAALILLSATVALAAGPTTSVQGDYLMTLHVPIAEAHDVDDGLRTADTGKGNSAIQRHPEKHGAWHLSA
jgi:hypothetical protein